MSITIAQARKLGIAVKGFRTTKPTGEMNKLEREYAGYLEGLRLAQSVAWYAFGSVKLRLADRTWYTPDFAVMLSSGVLEMHEVKGGFWEEDARVKIKVAAETYWMLRFIAVTKAPKREGGVWRWEMFHHEDERPI
jgi:hypothetical protein